MFSAFNPSKCTHLEQWAADWQRPGSSRGPPARARIRTHNLGLPRVSSPTLYPLGHDCPVLKCSLGVLLINCAYIITCADSYKMHLINQNLNEKVVHNSF